MRCMAILFIYKKKKGKKTHTHTVEFMFDFYQNFQEQFLNGLIITKTKVLLPQAQVTLGDFGCPVQALWFIQRSSKL